MSQKRNRHAKANVPTGLAGGAEEMLHEASMQEDFSELLMLLIKPYLGSAASLADFNSLVATACIAWNTALLPEVEWPKRIAKFVGEMPDMPEELRKALMLLIAALIDRKIDLFPNDTRLILKFSTSKKKGKFQIAVEATPMAAQ